MSRQSWRKNKKKLHVQYSFSSKIIGLQETVRLFWKWYVFQFKFYAFFRCISRAKFKNHETTLFGYFSNPPDVRQGKSCHDQIQLKLLSHNSDKSVKSDTKNVESSIIKTALDLQWYTEANFVFHCIYRV